MPSPPRKIDPNGGFYHVVSRGNNRNIIFRDEQDFLAYLRILAEASKKHRFLLHRYALMHNHVHLIIRTLPETSLAEAMQDINQGYSRWHKKRYASSGHLWQGRFKSYLIDRDSYLLCCAIYIELNPVRAGIVSEPGAHRWSSYAYYAFGGEDPLLTPDPFFIGLGNSADERRTVFVTLVKKWLLMPVTKKAAKHFFKRGGRTFHPLERSRQ